MDIKEKLGKVFAEIFVDIWKMLGNAMKYAWIFNEC